MDKCKTDFTKEDMSTIKKNICRYLDNPNIKDAEKIMLQVSYRNKRIESITFNIKVIDPIDLRLVNTEFKEENNE